jgi:hypothetical protein
VLCSVRIPSCSRDEDETDQVMDTEECTEKSSSASKCGSFSGGYENFSFFM